MSALIQSLRRVPPSPYRLMGLGDSITSSSVANSTEAEARRAYWELTAPLDGTEQQILLEIERIYQTDASIDDLKPRINKAIELLAGLHSDVEQAGPGQLEALTTKSQLVKGALDGVLNELITRRKNAEFGRASGAMLWGIGAAFATSAAMMWLWVNRKKTKRRRR